MEKQQSSQVKFKKDKDGFPILPSPEVIGGLGLNAKKKLIGRFMGDVYSVLTAHLCCRFSHLTYFQKSPSTRERNESPGRSLKPPKSTTSKPSIYRRRSPSSNTTTFARRTSRPYLSTGHAGKLPVRLRSASGRLFCKKSTPHMVMILTLIWA